MARVDPFHPGLKQCNRPLELLNPEVFLKDLRLQSFDNIIRVAKPDQSRCRSEQQHSSGEQDRTDCRISESTVSR